MSDVAAKIKPLFDYVVVEAIEAETQTASGIVIPDTASKEKPQKGKVVAVGPGATDKDGKVIPMQVSVGDTVLYAKYAPTEVKIDGAEYLFMHQDSLMAIVS